MTGIVISDYFLIRKGEYHIGDMYLGNSASAYWYAFGFNFRAFVAWVLGMAPLLRKSHFPGNNISYSNSTVCYNRWHNLLTGTQLVLHVQSKERRMGTDGTICTKYPTSTAL